AWLEAVVVKALEKDPARRYQDAGEMRQALRLAHERLFNAAKPNRFRMGMMLVAAVVLLSGIATAVVALRHKEEAVENASRAAGTLRLDGVPPGARVRVDGSPFDTSRPTIVAGRHHLHIAADGFAPLE